MQNLSQLKVSVIIPTYNRGDFLVETIPMIMENCYSNFELVIVDQTKEYPEAIAQELQQLRKQYNFEYHQLDFPNLPLARNYGVWNSTGDIIIFCDDDVILGPDYIQNHVQPYLDDEQVGGVAGRILSAIDEAMSHPSSDIGKLNPDGTFIANFHLEPADRQDADFGMGCNMSFRRSMLARAGDFDERYRGNFYREEGDAFARVKRTGAKIVFEPKAILKHLATPEGGCRKDKYIPRMYFCFRNETLFFMNCMNYQQLPAFLYRLLRWMYATTKVNQLGWMTLPYFMSSVLDGMKTYYLETPHQLSTSLNLNATLKVE
jgi:glycosyltransferase involved in cell wall biosynthesis